MRDNIAILRSIPLALETRRAWTSAGARMVPRKLIDAYVTGRRTDDDVIFINLGIRKHIQQAHVINPLEVIEYVTRPSDLRENLNNFLPPKPNNGEPYWAKAPGHGGEGKTYADFYQGHDVEDARSQFIDYQLHIRGVEYRINTVGMTVVQAHRKEGHENWEWCGLNGIKSNGIIPLLKEAISTLPYGDRTVLGWDMITDGTRPYIIECNTSAGVNEATARRICSVLSERS